MLEIEIENLIADYPDEFFPNEGFHLISRQFKLEGRRFDLLFEDKYKRKIIVEVKRGVLPREAPGQTMEYYGNI
jgi:DNA-binding sugar fermentation-stimulating protein